MIKEQKTIINKQKSNNNKLSTIILILILILGAELRLFWLHKSPPSLNWDETALGYNAYSLLTTGKDEYGYKFPLTFRSFDDYKPPLYPYITVPFIAVFGLNELSVRLPSALAGISIIIAIFLIASHLFNNRVGLFAAFFIAIEPWAIHFSRVAFETNLGLAFLLWSIYYALASKQKSKYLYLSFSLLFISAFAYHSYRVLLIPLIFLFLYINKELIKQKKHLISILGFIFILMIPLAFILKSGGGLTRLEATSIFRAVDFSKTNDLSSFTNLLYSLVKNIIGRYFAYYSPVNLFVRGTNEPNQIIHGFGLFYTVEFLFFLSGIFAFAKKKFQPKILVLLLLLSPLPAIITWNWFLPARVLILFALCSVLIGLGADQALSYLKNKGKPFLISGILIFTVIFLNNIGNLATTLFLYLPYSQRGNWQFGFREIMAYIAPIQDNYDQIIFETGHAQPHIFTLFYGNYPPERYHKNLGFPDAVEKPRKNFDFGNYTFRRIYWPDDRASQKTLFIGSEYSLPENDIKSTPNAKILIDVKDEFGDFVARIVEKE